VNIPFSIPMEREHIQTIIRACDSSNRSRLNSAQRFTWNSSFSNKEYPTK